MSKPTKKEEAKLLEQWQSKQKTVAKTKYNYIKLNNKKLTDEGEPNPDFGKVFAYTEVGSGEPVEEEIDITKDEFHLVRIRVAVTCKEYGAYFCPESEFGEDIRVYDGETKELVSTGQYRDLKDEFELKYCLSLYIAYKDAVYRWKVGPSVRDSVFDLKKELDKINKPMTFKISEVEVKKVANIFYNVPHFKVASEYPVTKALEYVTALDEVFNSRKQKQQEEEAKQLPQGDDEVKEVSVDDLPFD